MAGQGQGISVPISLLISNLLSIVNMLLSKLSNLKVGTAGFKSLLTIISTIQKDIDKLAILTDKPFVSANLFTAADRAVNKLEEDLDKVQIAVSRIKFSDLELDPSLTAELKAFETLIESIKNSLKTVKETAKLAFLDSDVGKGWAHDHAEATTLTLSLLTTAITKEVLKLTTELDQAKKAFSDYLQAILASKNINNFMSKRSGHLLSEATMGKELFDKVFKTDEQGQVSRFLNGGKTLLQLWLQLQFNLDSATVLSLTEGAGQAVVKAFAEIGGKVEAALKALQIKLRNAATELKTTTNNGSTLEAAVKEKTEKLNLTEAVQALLVASNTSVSASEAQLRTELELTKAQLADYKERLAQAVRTNPDWAASNKLASAALLQLRDTLNQTNGQFLRQLRIMSSFNSMKMAVVNFMGFNQVLNITRKAVREAINHIKELDTVMNGIAIVTDMSTGDLWTLIDQYSKMAQAYGVSITGAYEVSQIYYQQGLETADVMTLTNETLKLAKISGLDYATTTDYMTTAIRGFKMEMSEASTVVDVYSNLAAHTAVSQEELAVAMSKTASSMEGVGATFEEASAMIGTMVAVTRESATNIGSAMKSIASRYGELTKDPTKLVDEEGEAMAFNKVDAALQSVGISMKTVDGQFREFTDVIVELGEKWDQLDSTQQRYIATQFAGNRQQSRFLALVSNVDLLKSNLDVAMNSEDTGTLQALKALDSIESKIEQVKVAYQQFYTTIGAESVWKGLLDSTKNVINTLNGLPKLFGKIPIGAIAAISSIINVIKGLGVKLISGIAEAFGPAFINGLRAAEGSAQTGAEGIFTTILNTIKGKIGLAKEAGIETGKAYVEGAKLGAAQLKNTLKPEELNGLKAILYGLLTKTINNLKGIKNSEFIEDEIIQMSSSLTQDQLLTIYGNQNGLSAGINEVINKLIQERTELLNVGNAAELSKSKLLVFASKHLGLANGLQSFGSALLMASMMIDTSKPGMKTLSGTLMSISGAATMASVAMKALSAAANHTKFAIPWMAVISGIFALINGISTLIITPEEKLKELEDRAEDLNNKAKEAKAEYKTLDNSVKKLDELKEKRYESAEAAEEYLTAVDELADKFPLMIAGFDEAGNIIIDTTNAEHILAEAREKSKLATYDAALAELDASKKRRDDARQSLKDYSGMPSLAVNSDFDLRGLTEETRGNFLKSLGGSINPNELSALTDNIQALEKFYEAYKLNNRSDYSFLEHAKAENKTLNLELLLAYLEKLGQNRTEQELQIYDMFFSIETPTTISARFAEATTRLDTLLSDENASQEDILSAYTELESVFSLAVKSNQFEETDLANARQKITNIGELITTWTKENNIYKGFEKQVVSAWQQSSEADSLAWEILSLSSTAAAMVTKLIVNIIGEADFNTLKEDATLTDIWRGYQETMAAFINSLTSDELSDFERMMNDSANYTTEDFSERFGYKANSIALFLETWFSDGLTSINERLNEDLLKTSGKTNLDELTGFYKDLNTKRQNIRDNITTTEENYFHLIIALYDTLIDLGFTSTANNYGIAALSLFDSINSLNGDLEKTIWKLVSDNGLKTIEGINASIDAVNLNTGIKSDIKDQIIKYLNGIKGTIVPNLNLSIQTATSDLLENWSDTSSELSKAMESGLSLLETDKLIAKLESFNISVNLDTDFTRSGDKLILTAEKFTEYWQALANAANTNAADWQTSINTARAILGLMAVDPSSLDAILDNEDNLVALKTIGIDLTDEKYRTQDWNATLAEIDAAITSSSNGLQRFMWYNETAAKQLAETWNWEQGNYIGSFKDKSGKAIYDPIFNSIDELITGIAEDLSNPKANKKGTEKRDLLDHLYESYDALISDVLSLGLDNINLDNYTGLINDSTHRAALEEALKGSYADFITTYARFTGKSISETNDLLVQAIEKDREKVSVDLIKDLLFFNPTQFKTNLSGLNELASKLGKDLGWVIENAVISSNDAIDEYIVDATKIDNLNLDSTEFLNTILDSILDFFKSLASYISNALKGNLSSDNARELLEFATSRGIGELNFTRTAEGLKLSNDSAWELVKALREVDTILGNIAFDALKESLIESDDRFKSISASSARAAELRDALTFEQNIKTLKLNGIERIPLFDELEQNGNVHNLYKRVRRDNGDDTYSTLHTATLDSRNFSTDIPWVMNITPITAKGEKELSEDELYSYVLKLIGDSDGTLEGILAADAKDLGLIIEMADATGKDLDALAYQLSDRAELLHLISAAYEAILQGETYDDTKIKQYQEELRLVEEIQMARATTEDDSFKFMEQKIPSGQNNPLNYWANWRKAFDTMRATTKGPNKGTMAYEDFYNIVTLMGEIAKYTEKGINIGGRAVTNAETAAALINEAAAALTTTSTGEMVIDLSKIGINFSKGVDGMAEGVDAGIDAIADELIKMLDSMIQLMETVVAMEELGKIDIDEDNVLDLGEIFKVQYDEKGFELNLKYWNQFTDKYKTSIQAILDQAKDNEDLSKALDTMKIIVNDLMLTMRQIFEDALDGIKDVDIDAEAYTALLNSFYQAYLSNDYDLEHIFESIKSVFANTKFEGEILLGELTLVVTHGTTIIKTKEGDFLTSLGTTCKTAEEAIAVETLENAGIDQKAITYDEKIGIAKGTLEISGTKFTVTGNGEGNLTYSDAQGISGNSLLEYIHNRAEYDVYNGEHATVEEVEAELSIKYGITPLDSFTYLSLSLDIKSQLENALASGKLTEVDAVIKANPVLSSLSGKTGNEIALLLGIKIEDQNLNISVAGADTAAEELLKVLNIFNQLSDKEIKIIVTDEATKALALLKADLNNPENNDPIIKEVKARITEYINGEGENADPNKLVNDLQGILTNYENQIPEDLKKAIEGLIGIIALAQTDPNMSLPEIKDLVTNLTIEKNEPKEAIKDNLEEAKKDVTQNINLEKNATDEALQKNLNIDDVILNISVETNEVSKVLDANVEEGKKKTVTQSITLEYTGMKKVGDTVYLEHKLPSVKRTSSGEIFDPFYGSDDLATGNLAHAKGTLMGELGPELVVSNGRYFVAGQNGPEMVDLADDAIVFNHLQTKSLLEKGMSSGRGKAVTNERNAVAFATGNINGGPAMASASAALEALKQLRSMWLSLQKLGAKELAGKAGGGGGGGGGGDTDKASNFVKELEKWYNWLQEIAELEEQINYQEKLRSKIQSDMIPHGQDIATSYMTSLDALEKEIAVQEDLRNAQQEYFDQRRAWMNSNLNPFSSLYTFDENGQLKYANGKLEELSNMVGRNEEGKANYDAKEQYEMIQAMGYGDFLKYDSSGNEIELYLKDENGEYKLDEKGEKMVNADAYTTAVQAFWDKIDSDKEEMQSLHDSINEHRDAVLEKQLAMNEILKSIEDNLIAVENKVLDAMIDSREREIEESEKERAAIEKSSLSLIKGLSDQLNKERAMYEQLLDKNELNSLQRRLGILQRSGGSASEIASLQEQISLKQLDAYFDAQLNLIDALQEASDNELARLDALIELAKETLEYEKTYGLLWQKVSDELAKSPTEIALYIKENNSDYWGKSRTDLAQTMREDLMEAQEFKKIQENFDVIAAYYKAFDDAANAGAKGKWTQDDLGRWQYQKANGDLAKDSWEKVDDKWYRFDKNGYMQTGWVKDQDQWYHLDEESGAMDTSWFHDKDDKWYYLDETSGAMLSNTTKELMWNGEKANHSFDETGAWTGSTPIDATKEEEKEEEKQEEENNTLNKYKASYDIYDEKGNKTNLGGFGVGNDPKQAKLVAENLAKQKIGTSPYYRYHIAAPQAYAEGGLNNYTGLALLHGSPSKPEAVLTSEQTSTLRNEILGHRNDSLLSLLTDFREAWSETKNAYSSITRDSSVVIEHAEVNMNVESIDNDYGAQRAGEQALNQMMQIARKTQAQNRVS